MFLNWFDYIKENQIINEDLEKAIANIGNIICLQQQKENLEQEVLVLQEDRDIYLRDCEFLDKSKSNIIKNKLAQLRIT